MCQVDIIYVQRMIPCFSHFTVVVKDDTHWVYIHDRCVIVRSYIFQDLLLSHPNGWLQMNSGKDSEVCLISDKNTVNRERLML